LQVVFLSLKTTYSLPLGKDEGQAWGLHPVARQKAPAQKPEYAESVVGGGLGRINQL
jgi:hypothetical protein